MKVLKILKKISLYLLTLLLTNLIVFLILSMNIKKVIIESVVTNNLAETVIENIPFSEEVEQHEEVKEKIEEIINSEEMQEIASKYMDYVLEGLSEDDKLEDINIQEDIIKLIKENKKLLEEQTGIEIPDEMIDETAEKMNNEEMNIAIKKTIQSTKQTMSDKEIKIVKGYKAFINPKIRIYFIIAIIINLLLIILMQRPIYKSINNLGLSLATGGLSLSAIAIGVSYIVQKAGNVVKFNTTTLITLGIILIIYGLVLIVFYRLIKKIIETKKSDQNELSD